MRVCFLVESNNSDRQEDPANKTNRHFEMLIMKLKITPEKVNIFFCQDISEVPIGPCFLNYISTFQVQLEEKKNVIPGSLRGEGQDSDTQIWTLAVSSFQFISEAEWGNY